MKFFLGTFSSHVYVFAETMVHGRIALITDDYKYPIEVSFKYLGSYRQNESVKIKLSGEKGKYIGKVGGQSYEMVPETITENLIEGTYVTMWPNDKGQFKLQLHKS